MADAPESLTNAEARAEMERLLDLTSRAIGRLTGGDVGTAMHVAVGLAALGTHFGKLIDRLVPLKASVGQSPSIDELIAASSFGTVGARAVREQAPADIVERIVRAAEQADPAAAVRASRPRPTLAELAAEGRELRADVVTLRKFAAVAAEPRPDIDYGWKIDQDTFRDACKPKTILALCDYYDEER